MNEDVVHIKLEYDEAVESKRELLMIEMQALKAIKNIREYKHLRNQELKAKVRLVKKLKETLIDLRKIHRILPKVKLNKIDSSKEERNKSKPETKKEKEQRKKEQKYNLTLEQELQEIQRKLNSL